MTTQRCWLALALTSLTVLASAQDRPAAAEAAFPREAWDSETVELFGTLPVQDGGRIKPMDTLAGFKLLKMNGKRSLQTPSGEKLGHTAWLLDVLFFPEQARTYECFLVQNSQVLTAIGLEPKHRRDRYSYDELAPGFTVLFREASEIEHNEPLKPGTVERQILDLANNVHEFEELLSTLNFARLRFPTNGSPALVEIYGPERRMGAARAIAGFEQSRSARDKFAEPLPGEQPSQDYAALQVLRDQILQVMPGGLTCIPPETEDVEAAPEWSAPCSAVEYAFLSPRTLNALLALEGMEQSKGDRELFRAELKLLHTGVVASAKARGEYGKIPLEVTFYRGNFFTNALALFLLGFLLVAVSWLVRPSRGLQIAIWTSTGAATVLVVVGITLRCIIRSRPPVSTLYETILFISAGCVLVAMAIELMNRQRIALALSTVLGAGGMFLSYKYEFKEAITAGDTMPSLVAVLDTNFWLATHVTIITMGYAAGLLASAIAHVWLVGKIFGLRKGDHAFYKSIARMVYGVLCFGLLLSVVGTILGGVWANYSWGRFWGWDPKENGALLICIWELMILHARMAGFIRERGLAVMAIVGGLVVAFSWWGVNLLGIGLHSYGFTSGVFFWLAAAFVAEGLVLLAASGHWLFERGQLAVAAKE